MKIYYDYDDFKECISPCPCGIDCNVGSIHCMACRFHIGMKRNYNKSSIFFVGNKASLRYEDYVECCCGEEVTLMTIIKKMYYKIF